MFVAFSKSDERRINMLDSSSPRRIDSLRESAHSGGLTCPHCGQEVWVRQGKVRRPHFAHKSLQDCPFQKESAEVTEVKALLYGYFRNQPVAGVEMDLALDGEDGAGKLFLDLLVETQDGKRFGYGVFDRNRRDRHVLLEAAVAAGMIPLVIHTESVLSTHPEGDCILLSKSMRDLIDRSPFDHGSGAGRGGHLHFVSEVGVLTTFRQLGCVHGPNLFEWKIKREAPLRDVRFDPDSGDLVLEEDVADRMERERLEREREEQRRRREEERKKAEEERKSRIQNLYREVRRERHRPRKVREAPKPYVNRFNQPYLCVDCGVETRDWVKLLPSGNACICRACNAKRQRG